MIKKTIKYTDYNGVEQEEDHYFNLTEAEVLEMEAIVKGGFSTLLKHIIDADDTTQIITIFKDIIVKAYGVKSADGRRFIKSQEVIDEFIYSAAFSALYMELATDSDKAVEFVNGIIPKPIEPLSKVVE